jgi:hypothetical protein
MSAYAKKDVPKKIQGTQFECEDIDEEAESVKGPEKDDAVQMGKKMAAKSMKKKKPSKEDFEEMGKGDDMDDDEDDDEEEMSKTKKSVLTEASLRKSLRRLAGYVESNDQETRKSALLESAMAGNTLRKSERDELSALLAGRSPAHESAGEEVTKSMRENENIQKAIDVSEYLTAQHVELVKALGDMADRQDAMAQQQQEFNLMLAKAHIDTGSVVRELSKSMDSFAEAPMRAPKSAGITPGMRPLAKSFGAQAGSEGELNKSEVIQALTKMNQRSWEMGKGGKASNGEDLTKAVARFESSKELSDALRAEVVAAMRG